ncbi:MAG: glycosyltransferase, partial [Leeuwenhoekiella sp.]
MKIAILAHTLFPICEPYAGGMEMITHLLVKQLSERKHQVDLYAVSGSDPSLSIVRYAAKNDTQGGVTGSNDAQEDTSERFECYQLAEAMLKISIGDYDVVHNNTQHYLPVLLGEKLKTPFITTFHIPAFEFLQYAFSYIPRQYNQTFTAVSGHLSTVYERLGIHSRVVYNGVDLNFWEYSNEASENALVWFGRICPEKGTHQAINVAKKMNLKLYLAGP